MLNDPFRAGIPHCPVNRRYRAGKINRPVRSQKSVMKTKLIVISLAIIGCGISGLLACSQGPADEGAINRVRADKIMCQTYGNDWHNLLIASVTNRAQVRVVVATYEEAIGYHRTK